MGLIYFTFNWSVSSKYVISLARGFKEIVKDYQGSVLMNSMFLIRPTADYVSKKSLLLGLLLRV